MTASFFWLLIGCALVTLIPRILPFILVKRMELPEVFMKWLSYIPVCILTALIVDEMLIHTNSGHIQLNVLALIAAVPTIVVAFISKSLSLTVVVGVVAMAVLRFVM